MPLEQVNIGATDNDPNADTLRAAFGKVNALVGATNQAINDLGGVSQSIATKIENKTPLDTSAGLLVTNEAGGLILSADADALHIAGLQEAVQETLRKLEWRGVRAEALPIPVDALAMFDLTPDADRAARVGSALRGGMGAPMPAWQQPLLTPIGHTWLTGQTMNINWGDPLINADPFYPDNMTERSFVHPYVSYFPQRFMGWTYLMVVNPYPQTQPLYENPVLYGSENMQDWTLLTHIPQPLAWGEDRFPKAVGTYLSDPWMAYHPLTRELIVGWRRHLVSNELDEDGHTHRIEAITTFDGINWSPPRKIHGENGDGTTILSPSYLYNPSTRLWYCYSCRNPEWQVQTKRDLFDPLEQWSAPVDLGINGWHGEFRIVGNRVWFFHQTNTLWYYHVWWSNPADWTSFTRVSTGNGIIDASNFAAQTSNGRAYSYKSTFVPHLYPDGTANVKALIQNKRPENEWWLYFKETTRQPYAP